MARASASATSGSGLINFDFAKAERQAQQIETIAHDLNNIGNVTYQNSINSIRVCWKGEAANTFVGHCEVARADMLNRVTELRSIARQIHEHIRKMRELEEQIRAEMERAATAAKAKENSADGK
jgi:WXG100 family type VII secretion target